MKTHRMLEPRRWCAVASTILGMLAMTGAAQASQVGGWWGGNWKCNIDGRPARMNWSAVDDSQTSCSDGVCTSTSGARWAGKFSDNGARWVALRSPREGSRGMFFRHADGNQWYLAKPAGGKAVGWTTWQGKRYPLSCWR